MAVMGNSFPEEMINDPQRWHFNKSRHANSGVVKATIRNENTFTAASIYIVQQVFQQFRYTNTAYILLLVHHS